MAEKELQPAEKKEVKNFQAEGTRGTPYFAPHVDIYETEEALMLVADMPGVEGEHVEIDLKENVLTLQARISPLKMDGFQPVYREYREGNYYRQFIVSEIVDQEKIAANMSNGVLRVTLPKVAKALPRKISVKSA
jgi:HSP20 family protein